jgi:hypothetical protein
MATELVYYHYLYGNGIPTGKNFLQRNRKSTVDYYTRLKAGISMPVNPYSKMLLESNGSTCIAYKKSDYGKNYPLFGSFQNQLGGLHVGDFAGPYALADSKARESFYDNANFFQTQVGVTVAEFPKTVELIGSSARRIASAFTKLKRLDVVGAFKAVAMDNPKNLRHSIALAKSARNVKRNPFARHDYASNAWLEMTYGWKPLLADIDNVAHDLAYGWEQNEADFRIHGSGRANGVSHVVNSNRISASDLIVHRDENSVRVGYTTHVKVVDPVWRTLASIGVVNPLEIVWELLPYSFVVDWFIPIGSWISSLDATVGLEAVSGSKSVKKEIKYSVSSVPNAVVGVDIWQDPCHYQAHFVQFDRTVETGYPSANFLRVNPFQDFSLNHSISAIALLANAFAKPK